MATVNLFEPCRIGPIETRNRLVLSAVTRGMAEPDGMPTDEMSRYYQQFARNDVGLLVTEACAIPCGGGDTYLNQPAMTSHRHRDAWTKLVSEVKRHGSGIVMQLQHGGPFREPSLGDGVSAMGRSPEVQSWQNGDRYTSTRTATTEDLAHVGKAFAEAAGWAVEAGFDGVEIHGARGYLLDDFLRQENTRSDEYGGGIENRIRFPLEVVRLIRDAVPRRFAVQYNLSLYKMDAIDYSPCSGQSEIHHIVTQLRSAGIDSFHVSTRRYDRCAVDGVPFAQLVTRATDAPVVVGGGISDLGTAAAALGDTGATHASMARVLVANPDIVARTRAGLDPLPYRRGREKELVHS